MIAELMQAVADWRALVVVLAIWGFAPRAALRIIVLAFADRDRRAELLAEIYAVPRWERPLWVFEQLETAIFEGIWGRLVYFGAGIFYDRWHLSPGIPPDDEPDFENQWQQTIATIRPGTLVKLLFSVDDWAEGMWVEVSRVQADRYVGALRNNPIGIPRLGWGKRIKFREEHIIRIQPPAETPAIDEASDRQR